MLTGGLAVVSTVEHAAGITTQLLGLAAMAVLLSAGAAAAYRVAVAETVPRWLAVLAGVSGVALYLGTTPALDTVVRDGVEPGEVETALFNVAALLAGAGAAIPGRAAGDRFSADVLRWSPTQDAEEVSTLAQTVGQVTTVSLPKQIDDAAGYDPIPDRTKETLEGKKLLFPRSLTTDELETRLKKRLRSDYGIGTVDVAFDRDGNVSHLAVGTRAAGIGSTLPPATNAVAVRADPGFSASTGDIVQVWEPDSMERVLTGELRGVSGDIVTVAIDAADTPKVDPTRQYRLVTLPVEDRPDREFASLLRAAEETFSTATVEAGSPLHGLPVGALALTVTAIRPADGDPVSFPESTYRLAPGDLLYVIARPGELRRLETAATPLDPTLASESSPELPTDETPPTEGIQTGESETEREEPTGEDGLPATQDDGLLQGKADADSFEEIKAQFDEADAASEQDEGAEATSGEDDTTVTETTDETTPAGASDAETDRGTASFDELKAEFESGEADWDDTGAGSPQDGDGDDTADPAQDDTEDVEVAFEDDGDTADDGSDDLVSLEDAEISFEDEDEDDSEAGTFDDIEIDDGLQGEADDPLSDDIGDLEFEAEADESVEEFELDDGSPFDVDDETASEDTDEGEDGDVAGEDAEDDEDEDDSSGGGGKSFADLKAEFESGDADWEDDVSDSPGGDMRLDE